MDGNILYSEKHIEAKLSHIGATVVKASEMSELAGALLRDAQTEIADLYESLDDVFGGQREADRRKKAARPEQPRPPAD